MSNNKDAGHAKLREDVRETDGEAGVAALDAALTAQEDLTESLRRMIADHIKEGRGGHEGYTLAAAAEALALTFAESALDLGSHREMNDAMIVSLAIKAVVGNLRRAVDRRKLNAVGNDWLATLKAKTGEE